MGGASRAKRQLSVPIERATLGETMAIWSCLNSLLKSQLEWAYSISGRLRICSKQFLRLVNYPSIFFDCSSKLDCSWLLKSLTIFAIYPIDGVVLVFTFWFSVGISYSSVCMKELNTSQGSSLFLRCYSVSMSCLSSNPLFLSTCWLSIGQIFLAQLKISRMCACTVSSNQLSIKVNFFY